ncbi:MAG: DUF1476 domain-containing protein [Rhizobiales bacterium]|nr:DUF1476 domain-containing protein [Hyphomicrobiales bacterium]NRB13793.1 DUF1476 domain-containing protein [Hyphomicrobiales bacterium]
MADNFKDRETAFENKFAHDAEMKFKILARRDKLFGLWVAEILEKEGADADAYAKEVIISDLEEPGDADILRKVIGDLDAANHLIPEAELVEKLAEFLAVAEGQLLGD